MNPEPEAAWEARLRAAAAATRYPPTPDLVLAVRRRLHPRPAPARPRLAPAWLLLLLLLLLASTLLAPQVRAAVRRIFEIGAITIFEQGEPDRPPISIPSPAAPVTATPLAQQTPPPLSPAPFDLPDLAQEITLAEAAELAPFTLMRPTYPPGLGPPERVLVHNPADPLSIIFLWSAGGAPAQTRLALYAIAADHYLAKGAEIISETEVAGQDAVWIEGPHLLFQPGDRVQQWQFVAGNVLVWGSDSGVTYRLEGAPSLAEAVRMGESLAPVGSEIGD